MGGDWPAWRGPNGDGTSSETGFPIHWSEGSNLLWKVEVPGLGHASPIVFGNQVFLVTALPDSQERVLVSLDRKKGATRWSKTVTVSPFERKHSLNSHASSTPATDGQKVYVAFLEGKQMLAAAYDLDGKEIWKVRPGTFSSMHGFCSSPLLYQDLVILNGDHDGDSYLVALNQKDGSTAWKTMRENKTRSYCAPLIRELGGRVQMVLSGDKCVASYDPKNGKQHWLIDGPTDQFVASPVYHPGADLLFISGGYPDHHVLAINPHGTGNVTRTHITWRNTRGASYVPSPIAAGDYFLIVSDQNFATCFEARTGKIQWQERVGEHHASLVSAGGLVYFISDQGTARIVKPGPEWNLVAQNQLSDKFFASPALSKGEIFLRGEKSLYCLSSRSNK